MRRSPIASPGCVLLLVSVLLAGSAVARAGTPNERLRVAGQLLVEARGDARRIMNPNMRDLALGAAAIWQIELDDFSAALITAQMVGPEFETSLLLEIATRQRSAGDHHGSLKTFELARQAAIAAASKGDDDGLDDLLKFEIGIGDIQNALQIASLIADPYRRTVGLSRIADKQIERGDAIGAAATVQLVIETADDMDPPGGTDAWLKDIGVLQARVGDAPGMHSTLARIEDARAAASVRLAWAAYLNASLDPAGATRQFHAVRRLADAAQESSTRDGILIDLSAVEATAGQLQAAVATSLAISSESSRVYAVLRLAQQASDRGSVSESQELREQAGKIAMAVAVGPPGRSSELPSVVEALLGYGDVDGARAALLAAGEFNEAFKLWLAIARIERAQGRPFEASLARARAAARASADQGLRDRRLSAISHTFVEFGDMQSATEAAAEIAEAQARFDVLLEVANARLEAVPGDRGGLTSVSRASAALSAEELAARRPSLAELEARAGNLHGALSQLHHVVDYHDRFRVLLMVAPLQVRAGDRRSAAASLAEASRLAEADAEGWSVVDRLRQVAAVQATTGDANRAALTLERALERVALLPLDGAHSETGTFDGLNLDKPAFAALLASDRIDMGDVQGTVAWIVRCGRDPVIQASMRIGAAVALIEPAPMGTREAVDLLEPEDP